MLAGGLNFGEKKEPEGTYKGVPRSEMSVCGGRVGGVGKH